MSVGKAVFCLSGQSDIIDWTEGIASSTSAYLECSLTDTDVDGTGAPVYYVSLRVQNAASLWSNAMTSTPVVVVPEDLVGMKYENKTFGKE